jgi:mycofactocin system creatininase family protein
MPAQPPAGPRDRGFILAAAHWPDVEAGARQLLVVPVGSLEQHGPHLPLDTDTRIAVTVAERACAGRAGVGLAPAVAIGASGEHADFPGTLSIGHVALSTLLVELGRHASLHWPAMLLVNGHGGNAAAISDALGQLRAESRGCHVWHAGIRPSMLAAARTATRRGADGSDAGNPAAKLAPDAHAGRAETSMMLALAPGDVRLGDAAAGETRPLTEIMADLRAGGVRQVSPNGVLGDPAGASAAEGETLLALLVADLAATLDRLTGAAGGRGLAGGPLAGCYRTGAAAQPGRTTRLVEGGLTASRRTGRTGRLTNSPPQLGQTPLRTFSAQSRHHVHS